METVIWVLHALAALAVVGLVLLQHGKGADMGAAFGSGSAGGLFGSSGSANFLSRTTAILAVVFFATSLGLTYYSSQHQARGGVMQTEKFTGAAAPGAAKPGEPAGDSKAKDIPK